MEQFLLENAQRHQALVKRFVPPPTQNADPEPTGDLVVATRIRPMLEDELSSGQVSAVFTRRNESGVVDLHELKRAVRGLPPLNSSCFRPGKVYSADRTTDAIYKDMVQPLLPWAWDGNVGTLFAYGQTGSGKTFSISRMQRLAARALFDGSLPSERKVHVSIFELAGNSARDLLSSQLTGGAPIQLLEDSLGEVQLIGAVEHEVTFAGELIQLIEQTTAFRKTAPTEKNNESSRSHSVCRLRIVNPSPDVLDDGYLYLIDLARSEAARDIAEHTADRMKETREINISLSILKDCIRALSGADSSKGSKKSYVPFRQSTLTKTLKHVFDPSGGRKCKTAVLACINPSFLDTSATKNTLRYAEMLLTAQPTNKPPGYNPNVPMTWTNKDVRNFIMTKSGNPSIAPYNLAPKETGAQLLRLPIEEFVQRSLQTSGVTEDQAKAFHFKLWTLHTNSQRKPPTANGQNGQKVDPQGPSSSKASIRNLSGNPNLALQFTERIRPGMTIRWNPPTEFSFRQSKQNLAVVLCPQNAVGDNVIDALGKQVSQAQGEPAFLCALVLPGESPESYELHLWKQVVVHVSEMQAEVFLEYDAATRYYHTTL